MGTDCIVKSNNEFESLDRWYVFSQDFKSGVEYPRQHVLKVIRKLVKNMKRLKNKPTWGDGTDRTDYYNHWYLTIRKLARSVKYGEYLTFYDEHSYPDEYWNVGDYYRGIR